MSARDDIKKRWDFSADLAVEQRTTTKVRDHQKLMAQLVVSPFYPALKDEAARLVDGFKSAPALRLDQLLGYTVFNYVRDAMNGLFTSIESQAALGRRFTTEDEETIDVG
jgi:hypothetical protein